MIASNDHAMTCNLGGFPTIHHNEMRVVTTSLLSEVCHNVAILQPLNGEGHLKYANTDEIHVSIIQWRALFAMPMAAKEVGGVNLCVTQQETRIAPRMGVALKCTSIWIGQQCCCRTHPSLEKTHLVLTGLTPDNL